MRWIVTAVCLFGTALALADHGVPAPTRTGLGWMSWLLVAGAVVAVSLAAWAFFAPDHPPDRPERGPGPSPRERPGADPPSR